MKTYDELTMPRSFSSLLRALPRVDGGGARYDGDGLPASESRPKPGLQ